VMNERIEQLAEQVGAVRNVLAMGRHDGVLFTEFELEKFAELIVRECIAKCDDLNSMKYIADHFEIKIEGLNDE
jgi:hypothetical protein